jgi:hypothetical protein
VNGKQLASSFCLLAGDKSGAGGDRPRIGRQGGTTCHLIPFRVGLSRLDVSTFGLSHRLRSSLGQRALFHSFLHHQRPFPPAGLHRPLPAHPVLSCESLRCADYRFYSSPKRSSVYHSFLVRQEVGALTCFSSFVGFFVSLLRRYRSDITCWPQDKVVVV